MYESVVWIKIFLGIKKMCCTNKECSFSPLIQFRFFTQFLVCLIFLKTKFRSERILDTLVHVFC